MNNFESRYQKLNEKQREAVDSIEGPLLVVAGPGSGKTELLSLRAANILKETQVSPGNILLLTFTENGAKNMRERLVGLIGEAGYRVAIYTFHAFAGDVMSKYGEYFFEGATFRPATEIEKINIVEKILESLPKENPLASKHTEMGFTYLKDIFVCISALKKGNLSGEEFKEKIKKNTSEYEEINTKLSEYFFEIAGKSKMEILRETYLKIYSELKDLSQNENETATFLLNILSLEISLTENTGKANNLTAWKNKYFTKDESGDSFILKDSRKEKIERWFAFEDIYEKYNQKMNEAGLYDFDDMIFKVGRELDKNIGLRNELEERYQYIMIDEFQDTSDSQFNLILNLTKSEINEGRANIMAVGDDDQAIFKFQGAELDNITKFRKSYRDVKVITLDKNYRSTQNILDEARNLIVKIEDRLETRFPDINKKIKAENENLIKAHKGEIIEKTFDNIYSEFDFVAKEIDSLLKNGVKPEEISVISRTHANLKQLALILNEYKIPYSYEKEENVFDKEIIKEIITLVEFAESGLENIREDLLPEILTYKFWNIPRIEVWKIAEKVRAREIKRGEAGERIYIKPSWMETMLESENQEIKEMAKFLIELATDAKSLPLLHLIDKIIGTREWEVDSDYDDSLQKEDKKINYLSPFREYYFGQRNFDHNKPEYLDFLFSLRTFIGSLREYKGGEILYAKDLKEFVNIYENNSYLSLSTISPFATSEKAIILQTAHKSKGLEYEYVFILNSDEDEWNGRAIPNKIGMPINMPLLPLSDDISDRVRLYYVAMTRAKHTLYMTNNKDKFSMLLSEKIIKKEEEKEISEKLVNSLFIKEGEIFLEDEKVLLKRILENYKMPVTHLINFLNIERVGPEKFLEQNLLRFPQAMSPTSIYGSAMHEALQNYYLYKKKYDKNPDFDRVINFYRNALNKGALDKIQYEKYYNFGVKNLETFIEYLEKKEEIGKIEVEVNFANEGVMIKNVPATGKIDKLVIEGGSAKVIDFKTGKSIASWEKQKSDYEKIKVHFFKYQLAYYALLLKNSRSYEKYNFDTGTIEFLEVNTKNEIESLKLENDKEFLELIERVEKLANIVYEKIMNLDFPDTSKYKMKIDGEEKNVKLKDILAFEDDLLEGKI